jgi:anti-sigma-K factor RskA
MTLAPSEHDDLDWLAFRYVAGEMNPAEAAAFEGRLADEQSVREAVCRAVALSDRLAAAMPVQMEASQASVPSLASNQSSWRRSALRAAGWMSLGAAAALIGIVVARPGFLFRPGTNGPANPARPVANAVVWARLQTASQWADEQDQRWLDEVELRAPMDVEDIEPAYPSPTWLHAIESQK